MPHIVACIDGSVYSESVADHAAWAGVRLEGTVEILSALGGADADATRARLRLGEIRARVESRGVKRVGVTLRQDDLLDAIAEREGRASLIAVGKRGAGADVDTVRLGSNLERLVRAARRPVLVTSRAFRPVRRALIAFDGGPSALKAVDHVSRSPLFVGLALDLVTVGTDEPAAWAKLDDAAAQLAAGGHRARTHVLPGAPIEAIAAAVADLEADLLVMGAYGHTRMRALFIGSTTTEMIRSCRIPVLLFR